MNIKTRKMNMEDNHEHQGSSFWGYVWDIMKDVIPAAVIAFIVFRLLFNIVVVQGESMEPTINNGSIVIVRRIGYTPKKGDIITFDAGDYGKRLIKRVIATEGDTVDIDFESGTVYVNGEALDEPYVAGPTYKNEGMQFPIVVEEDHIFVLGDNRNNSYDSRLPDIGQVPIGDVVGGYMFTIIK